MILDNSRCLKRVPENSRCQPNRITIAAITAFPDSRAPRFTWMEDFSQSHFGLYSFPAFFENLQLFVVSFSIGNSAFISTQVYLSLSFISVLYCRAKTQRNRGLLTMSGFTQLHRLDMEMHLMVRLPAYVCGVLFIMILTLGKRIPQRRVSAATFSVTQRLETKFKSQVRTPLAKRKANVT